MCLQQGGQTGTRAEPPSSSSLSHPQGHHPLTETSQIPGGIQIYLQFLGDFFFHLFRYEILKDKAPAKCFCFCFEFLFSNKLPGINTTCSGIWVRGHNSHQQIPRAAHATNPDQCKRTGARDTPICRESQFLTGTAPMGLTDKDLNGQISIPSQV